MLNHPTYNHPLEITSNTATIDRMLRDEHCHRCGGLMIHDYCLDVGSDNAEVEVTVKRCCMCGELIDPTILRNRMKAITDGDGENDPTKQVSTEHQEPAIQNSLAREVLHTWYATMRSEIRENLPIHQSTTNTKETKL
ncbi:hypothetical protein [Candidatus Nitrospira salsa]